MLVIREEQMAPLLRPQMEPFQEGLRDIIRLTRPGSTLVGERFTPFADRAIALARAHEFHLREEVVHFVLLCHDHGLDAVGRPANPEVTRLLCRPEVPYRERLNDARRALAPRS